MTLQRFRELVLELKDKPLDAADRRRLAEVIKHVADYQWLSPPDIETMTKLEEKYDA